MKTQERGGRKEEMQTKKENEREDKQGVKMQIIERRSKRVKRKRTYKYNNVYLMSPTVGNLFLIIQIKC